MAQNIKEKILSLPEHRLFGSFVITALIVITALTAFGVKTFSLGFFNDDWHHIYYAYLHGLSGLKQFLFFDSRPLAFIVYGPLFALLGFQAVNWHIMVLLLRVITVLIFWLLINRIWTENKKDNGLVALLFLVYPAYQLQPIAVAYTMHWLLYAIFMLSLFAMIRSVQDGRRFVLYTVISVLLQIFHLVVFEYFAGAELIRPFLLWLILKDLPPVERLKKTVQYWLPYLIILAIYTVFRASYSSFLGYDRNTPVILLGLFSTPLTSIFFLLQAAIKDFIDVLLSVWNESYQPANFNLSVYSNLWVLLLSVFCGGLAWLGFSFIQSRDVDEADRAHLWGRTILVFGAIFLFMGFLPPWFAGRTFFDTFDALDDRLVLPGIYGASMIWVGAVYYLARKRTHRYLLIGILIALAVGLQLRTNNQYAAAWRKQSQFYWQLYWRAPSIEPNTAFISEGEMLPLMGVHPTIYAINLLYPSSDASVKEFKYGLFVSGEGIGGSWEKFQQGIVLEDSRFGTNFAGSSRDTMTILFNPGAGQCLWILRPEDKYIRNMPELTYESLPMSNLSRISQNADSDQPVPYEIFGAEPSHTWCFYYEKAELARQYQNWPEVTKLWAEAQKNGLSPSSGAEYLVFIDGFIAEEDWDQALSLTLQSNKSGNSIRPTLCEFWVQRLAATKDSPERQKAIDKIDGKLGCFE